MASKQVIETNKLKIGSSGATALYVGGTESKYAVMTDSAKTQTVIYDKVTYNFTVADLTSTVPPNGGTYAISASVSTRTHGNGAVDNVTFSPTTITIPANTGSSYSSSVTVTQTTSNLTDAYNYTVAADYVTGIVLSLSGAADIPASGGSVGSCTTSATVTYKSGRQITSFTPTTVKWGTAVSASTKGTTVSERNSAGTLTCYVVFGGVTSNTASITIYQGKNEKISTNSSPSNYQATISIGDGMTAAGGSATVTFSAYHSAYDKYTSGSENNQHTVYDKATVTEVTDNNSRYSLSGTTSGTSSSNSCTVNHSSMTTNVTTDNLTLRCTNGTSTSVTKDASRSISNAITSYTDYQAPTGMSISASKVPAGGGTATITWSGTCKQNAKAVYTSTSTAASYTELTVTPTTAVTGNSAVGSKGTTISNETTAIATVTGTYTANNKSSTTTCSVKQNPNYVTAVQACNSSNSASTVHYSYSNISAGATSASPSMSGGAVYTFTSGSKVLDSSTAPSFGGSASYSRSFTLASSQNGFTAVNAGTGVLTATSRGTTIGNARSSANVTGTLTVTYTHASSYSAGGNVASSAISYVTTCTQNGNYVTAISVTTNPAISIAQIGAGGGSNSDTGTNGAVTYTFSSGSDSTTAPGSTYGTYSVSKSYSMTAGNGFTLTDTSVGTVSAETRGTTTGATRNSNTITKSVTYTWTPTASYNTAGTKTASKNATGTASQQANAEGTTELNAGNSSYTATISIGNGITAAGGSATVTASASHTHYYRHQYTSGSYTGYYTNTVTDTANVTEDSDPNNRYSYSNGTLTHSSMGTYVGTDSCVLRVRNASNTATTNTASASTSNAVTSTTWSNPTVTAFAYGTAIPAGGGTTTPTSISASQSGVNYYTSGSSANTSNSNFTYSYAMTASGRWTLKSTSTGQVSASTRGTTTGDAESSPTITVTATGAGSKTATKTATATQAANSYTDTWNKPVISTFSYASFAAGGASKTPTLSISQSGTRTYTSGSEVALSENTFTTTFSMTSGNGFALANTSNGSLTADTLGTTISNGRTSNTISVTATAHSKTSDAKTTTASQAANYVSSITFNSNASLSYAAIGANGGTSSPSLNSGALKYVFTSGSNTTTAPGSTYGSASSGKSAYSMTTGNGMSINTTTGVITADDRTTTIGNDRNSNDASVTVTWTWTPTASYPGGTKTVSQTPTAKCKQNANYVASLEFATDPSLSYTSVGAASATSSPSFSQGTPRFVFTSGSKSTSAPSTTYGTLSSSATNYSMTSGNGFTITASNGVITAETRGTTIGNARTSNSVSRTVTYTWTPTSSYPGGTKTVDKAATATCSQNGNYVTSLTVSTNPAISIAQIPAGGGSKSDTGTNGGVTFNFSSGSNTTTTPGATYGTYSVTKSYAMTNGGGFYLTDTAAGTVSADTRGTTTGATRSSNTITKSVTYTWTPTTSYNAAGTKTTSKDATGTATQQANNYSDTWNKPVISTFSYAAFAAGGATKTPSISTTQSGTRTYTSGSEQALSESTFTYTYSMTNGSGFTLNSTTTGSITAASLGTTISNGRSNTTPAVYAVAHSKTSDTKTTTVSQNANYVDSLAFTTNPSLSYSNIGAGGGTSNPTLGAGAIKYVFTSGSESSTAPTSTYGSIASSTTGNYAMTAANGFTITTSSGVVSAETRGTTTGDSRTSNTITGKTVKWTWTPTASYPGGTKTCEKAPTATCTQSANSRTSTNYSPHSAYANITIGSGIVASGGTATVTYSAGHYAYDLYSSGSYNNEHAVGGDTAEVTETADANARYSLSGTTSGGSSCTLVHDNMTTNVTTDSVTLRCTNKSYSATKDASTSVSNAEGTTELNAGNSAYTASVSIGNGMTAAGGSATVTYAASHIHYYRHQYTSGSYTGYYTPTATDNAKIEITSNGNSRFHMTTTTGTSASNTITMTHDNMTTNLATDSVTVKCTNLSDTTKTATASKDIVNSRSETSSGNSAYTVSVSIQSSSLSAAGGQVNLATAASHTHYYKYTYTSGSVTPTSGHHTTVVNDACTLALTTNGNSRFSLEGAAVKHTTMGTNVTTDNWEVTATNNSATNSVSGSVSNAIVSYTDYQAPTGMSISASKVPAGGGTATITWSGTCKQNAKAVYTSNATASSYTQLTVTPGTQVTGNSAVSSKGTTISNETTAIATVTGNYTANGKTGTTTCSVTQAGNYVSSLVYTTNPSLSYSGIGAGGGTSSPNLSSGAIKYVFTSGSESSSAPSSTYGSISSGISAYAMTAGNGMSINTTSGVITAENRGSTTGSSRTSNSASVTVTWTWTPTTSYNAGETKTASKSASATCTQAANTATETSGNSAYTASISIGSGIAASGGSATVTYGASHTHWTYTTYTSGSRVPTSGANTSTASDSASVAITTNGNNRFSLSGTTSGGASCTLNHSTMGTNEVTDTCVVKVTNDAQTSATAQTSVSVSNSVTATTWDEPDIMDIGLRRDCCTGFTAMTTASGRYDVGVFDGFTDLSGFMPAVGGFSNPYVGFLDGYSYVSQSGTLHYKSGATAGTSTNSGFTYGISYPTDWWEDAEYQAAFSSKEDKAYNAFQMWWDTGGQSSQPKFLGISDWSPVVGANRTNSVRTCPGFTFYAYNNGKTATTTFNITQAGGGVSASTTYFSCTSAATSLTISIKANVDWSVQNVNSALTLSIMGNEHTAGQYYGQIVVDVPTNDKTYGLGRTFEIKNNVSNEIITVTISQAARPAGSWDGLIISTPLSNSASTLTIKSRDASTGISKLEYSKDGGSTWIAGTATGTLNIPMSGCSTTTRYNQSTKAVYLRGDNFMVSTVTLSTGVMFIEGNIMSLIDKCNYDTLKVVPPSAFTGMFSGQTIGDFRGLILPGTQLGDYCYQNMFYQANCVGYSAGVPMVPPRMAHGEDVAIGAYACQNMFRMYGFFSTTPTFNITSVKAYSCQHMFDFGLAASYSTASTMDNNVTFADGLQLFNYSLDNMYNYTSLSAITIGNIIPASYTSSNTGGAYQMLAYNPKLARVKIMAEKIPPIGNPYNNWLYNLLYNSGSNVSTSDKIVQAPYKVATRISDIVGYNGYYRTGPKLGMDPEQC